MPGISTSSRIEVVRVPFDLRECLGAIGGAR